MTNPDFNHRQEWHCKCGEIHCRPSHLGKPVGWKVIETDGEQELLCGSCVLLASINSNSKEISGGDSGLAAVVVRPNINANIFLRLGLHVDQSKPDSARISITNVDFLGSEGKLA